MVRGQQRVLLGKGLKDVMYCKSKVQRERPAEEIGCLFYHADVLGRAECLVAWLE